MFLVNCYRLFLIVLLFKLNLGTLDFGYHDYNQVTSLLKNYSINYPDQCIYIQSGNRFKVSLQFPGFRSIQRDAPNYSHYFLLL